MTPWALLDIETVPFPTLWAVVHNMPALSRVLALCEEAKKKDVCLALLTLADLEFLHWVAMKIRHGL